MDKNFLISTAVVVITLLVLASGAIGLGLWRASIQKDVYHRQGVEMTTFEVFMGAKPIERSLVTAPSHVDTGR